MKDYIAKRLRVNQQIKVPSVRLIDEEGTQHGVMSTSKALEMAREKDLDLAEVSPNSQPPVCKIMDYGKFQYHKKKIETKHRKMQKKTEIKGVRIGFKTGDHDLMTKAKQATKFLGAGNVVKVSLIFRGREAIYKDLAKAKMNKFYEELKDVCSLETAPKGQGNTLIMILTPNKS